jgi:Protein of unknown function (DUF664)
MTSTEQAAIGERTDLLETLTMHRHFLRYTVRERRALLHVIAETAQHAGHADIIRESLDGAKSMG